MKRILIVNNLLGYYGAENVLNNLIDYLHNNNYDVSVLTLKQSFIALQKLEINYYYIFSDRNGLLAKIENKLKLIAGWRNLAKKYDNKYDIVIAFKMGECAHLVGYIKCPLKYCWIHSNVAEIDEQYSYSFTSLHEESLFLREHFTKLIAVSRYCLNSFFKKYGKDYKTQVIYNPVNYEAVQRKSNDLLPKDWMLRLDDKSIPIIGTVGRLEEKQKQFSLLINVSIKLKNNGIDHKLIIVGDGEDAPFYQDLIKQNNASHVFLTGFQSNPYQFMRKFSVFVCSSIWESYSLVVNEALVLGIPVISTKCGGPSEVLEDGKYGVLIDNTEDALYDAIFDFLNNDFNPQKYPPELAYNRFVTGLENLLEDAYDN